MAAKARKVVDSTFVIPRKRGNGTVRREIWVDSLGRVSRYNLAYVNHRLYPGDNGRVLGYDNAHDFHHRHLYGSVTSVPFAGFDAIEKCFEEELSELLKEARK
ncbi:MAG: hypothetical protein D4R84_18070 [Rhodocyclaceae bacterium]|nr:MAG: hypothetical protein D4R84_18070 [Rhodocyclaceae bacterium]